MKKRVLYLVSSFLLLANLTQAQSYEEVGKVFPTPDLTAEGRKFGTSVAIDGDYAAVSDPIEGAVSVLRYEADAWQRVAKLFYPAASAAYASRGAVAMRGDVIAVAAPHKETVFVFEKPVGGWIDTEEAVQLTLGAESESASVFSVFGISISLTDDGMLVGSERDATYLFQKSADRWMDATPTASLNITGLDQFDRFGGNVCFLDTVALVTADGLNNATGGVYVFRRPNTGWTSTTSATLITANDGEERDYFGSSLDASFGHLVVGAKGANRNGAVYVFGGNLTSNDQEAKLTRPDGFYDGLGTSVATSYRTIVAGTEDSRNVYVFEIDPISYRWKDAAPTAALTEPRQRNYTRYAVDIHASDNSILVGAPGYGEGGTLYAYQKSGSSWVDTQHQQKLTATQEVAATLDGFGSRVAIDGDYAVVSSPSDDEVATNGGAAYVVRFSNNQWNKVAKLTLSEDNKEYTLAGGIAISGNTIVLGVNYHRSLPPATFIYEKPSTGWEDMTETAKLSVATAQNLNAGYTAVGIDGNTIAIGVRNFNGYASDAVLIYEKPTDGWVDMTQTAVLTSINEDNREGFGVSVAVSNNTIVVGNPKGDDYRGTVHVFERPTGGWEDVTQTAKLSASDKLYGDKLGESLAIDGTTIVAGVPGRTFGDKVAFVYEKPASGWTNMTETARLTSSSNSNIDMGESISISDNTIVLESAGKIILYEKPRGGWTNAQETMTITSEQNYARAVAISGSSIIAGNSSDNTQGEKAGAAFFYSLRRNTPPALVQSIVSQIATESNRFSFIPDATVFTDADNDVLTYSATQEDGSALPAWLTFDGTSRSFGGTPSATDVGTFTVRLIARDSYGEASTTFAITVQEKNEEEPNREEPEAAEESTEEDPDTEEQMTEEPEEDEQPVAGTDEPGEEDMVTGIEDDTVSNEVLLYPNPGAGWLNVHAAEGIQRVILSNTQGRTLTDQRYPGARSRVVLEALPRGVYHVRIQTTQKVVTRQIIVR